MALLVSEQFGPVFQGEGNETGRKTYFIRFYGCDYKCEWCDSKFSWDGTQKPTKYEPLDLALEVVQLAKKKGFDHVTITGGNPGIYDKDMAMFIDSLQHSKLKVAVETQGSIIRDWMLDVDNLVISPKPPSSQNPTPNTIELIGLLAVRNKRDMGTIIKVPVFTEEDIFYAKSLNKLLSRVNGVSPLYLSVGNPDVTEENYVDVVMTSLERLRKLQDRVANDVELKNVCVSPQLHVLVHGNRQGV